MAALANPRREISRFVVTANAVKRLANTPKRAEEMLPADIDRLLPAGAVHQGIAAAVTRLSVAALEDVVQGGARLVCVLDQVSDPHNLGAIFRSAAAFGAGALILQTRNAPEITGVAAKSAAGAIETVTECRVTNIARALDQLGAAGFHVIGLAGGGYSDIQTATRGARKIAIVLGAEGPGLRPAVAKACAELAHIPIDPAMESLNVSNAAAIAFYEAAQALRGS